MVNQITFLTRVFILLTALLMAAFPTTNASARLVACRTDPIFYLSNGDKITVTMSIETSESNIRNVSYELHVPAGVTVNKVVYTAGGIGTKEVYRVIQDSPAKTYTVGSLVTTQNTGAVKMTAYVKLNSLTTRSASGYTGQIIAITVSKP